jgi:hypothetical protein
MRALPARRSRRRELLRVAVLQVQRARPHILRAHVEGAAKCAGEIGRALETESVGDFRYLKMRETD